MSAPYTHTVEPRHLLSLDPEGRARTCSYWYVAQTFGCGPLTAFRTRAALMRWLDMFGLAVTGGEIPPEGEFRALQITGSYRVASYMDRAAFGAISGETVIWLDNARYTLAKLTKDADGIRTLHHLNCNVERPEMHWEQARDLTDKGLV